MATEIIKSLENALSHIMASEDPWPVLAAICLSPLVATGLVLLALRITGDMRQKDLDHPVMAAARRLSNFYLDRPLPAILAVKTDSWASAREAAKQEFPPCDPGDLAEAIREAEYNEFVAWELDREIREFGNTHLKAKPRILKIAVKELRYARKLLPSGITVRLEPPRGRPKVIAKDLEAAHAWLDEVKRPKIGSETRFRTIRKHKFRCAKCGTDWNDGARLELVQDGRDLVPVCAKCRNAS